MEKLDAFDLQPEGLFAGLSPVILRDVSRSCTQVLIPAGHLLFKRGDASDSLYIVSAGRLAVCLEQEGEEPASIYEITRGHIVGEMGVLTGDTRSATVRSIRDSVLLRLSKERFDELLERHPALTRQIACDLSGRLKHSNIRPVKGRYSVKTFAVIPAGEVAPTAQFVQQLSGALHEIGSTRRITKAMVEQAIGTSDMSDGRVVRWLDEQESKFEFLIYEADLQATPWTFRCIRQADRLLSVARIDGNRGLNEIELKLARMASEAPEGNPLRVELILLHRDANDRPSGTPEWLAARSLDKHLHVCDENPKDLRRLAQVLTGKAIGLVLGGGGARCFAHIGAIRAIEEAGIAIERIGGTSQGALIGAQYAMGMSPSEMIAANRALFRDFRPFRGDMTLPVFSFLSGATSNKGLQGVFGRTDISDLKIPFFCISNNLSLAKLIVHRDQLVWKAVRCSMALPGLMAPVIEGGHLIVDGGLLNNLPVDIMRQHCDGRIIAVDVSPPVDLIADCEDKDNFSFLDFVRRKLFKGKKKGSIPHVIEILMRTAFLSSIYHREAMSKYADLVIHPPMAGFSLLGWENLETLVEIGYQTTREKLSQWAGPAALQSAEPDAEESRPEPCETGAAHER